MAAASGGGIGLVLGDVLTYLMGRHFVFFVNIPMRAGVCALCLVGYHAYLAFRHYALSADCLELQSAAGRFGDSAGEFGYCRGVNWDDTQVRYPLRHQESVRDRGSS